MSSNIVDHEKQSQTIKERNSKFREVEEILEICSRALSEGEQKHYVFIAHKLENELLPLLEQLSDKPLEDYDTELTDHDLWYWMEFNKFRDKNTAIVRTIRSGEQSKSVSFDVQSKGYVDARRSAELIVERALRSCTALAEAVEAIQSDLTSTIDVNGFSTKLGEQHVNPRSTLLEGPVRGVSMQAGSLKTLFSGGTGLGKSTGLEREAEDFYLANWLSNDEYKVIDLVDLGNGENWFYDVPMQQNPLKWIQEKMGIEPEVPFSEREIEIYVPLTPGITEKEFPFDTDSDQFKVKFFTFPASHIRKPLLVQLLLSRLTPQEKNELELAYEEVDEQFDDWALEDLADRIRDQDDLSEKKQRRAIRVLRALQNRGYIRTEDDPHVLDWEEISKDTKTITLFSQARMETDLGKFMCVALLLDRLIQLRRKELSDEWPEAALLMRELWQIVPHQRRDEFDERVSAIQEALGSIMSQTFRRNRHIGVHLLFDTQEINDLTKAVREMFNRYVIYSANWDTTKDVFSWTSNDKRKSFWNTLNQKKGQAGVVGQVEPAIERNEVEFLSPVSYAPPTHHHFDKDNDSNGWKARVKYVDSEVLRKPSDVLDIDDRVPEHLNILVEDPDEDAFSIERHPVLAFVDKCLERDSGNRLLKHEVYDIYNAFRLDNDLDPIDFNDLGNKRKFGHSFRDAAQNLYRIDEIKNSTIDGAAAYRNWRYTWLGEQYKESSIGSLSESSEPIDTER